MKTKPLRLLIIFMVLLALSFATTIASYRVITGRNVKLDSLKEYVTIDGKTIINLPCGSMDESWRSDKPVQPETRGLPFNYHFWNPCYGNKILLYGFTGDILFWITVYGGIYAVWQSGKIRLK